MMMGLMATSKLVLSPTLDPLDITGRSEPRPPAHGDMIVGLRLYLSERYLLTRFKISRYVCTTCALLQGKSK